MKKLFIITATLLLLFSCGNKNTCNIEKAFRQYVAQNFDDPKSVVEIMEISLKDTFSYEKVKFLRNSTQDIINKGNERVSELWNDFKDNSTPRRIATLSNSTKRSVQREMHNIERINLRQKGIIDLYQKSIRVLDIIAESVIDKPPIYFYEIKFKKNVNGEPQSRTFYASYTKEIGKITILETFNESIDKYNGSEAYFKLGEALLFFFGAATHYTSILDESINRHLALVELIK